MLINNDNILLVKNNINWTPSENILFIDPGFNTGMCIYSDFEITCLGISTNNKLSMEEKMIELYHSLDYAIQGIEIKQVVCEDVFFRQGSKRSIGSVMSQDLFKTAKIIGLYNAYFIQKRIPFTTIHAHTWRGQMNDEAVKLRCYYKLINSVTSEKKLLLNTKSSHICSALGMLLNSVNFFSG